MKMKFYRKGSADWLTPETIVIILLILLLIGGMIYFVMWKKVGGILG